jgi:purine-binding chemotaxis protein CheW
MFKSAKKTVAAVVSDIKQYLTFTLGKEVFALDILVIKEIIQFAEVSTVPMMPDYIRGIINLRGAVVPVIDLHVRFGRAPSEIGKRSCIVILEIIHEQQKYELGIMVDAVSAVVDIGNSQIEPAPRFGTNTRNDFIAGMGKLDEQFIIILDIGKTFTPGELAAMDQSRPA